MNAGLPPAFQEKEFRGRNTSLHYAEGPAAGPELVLLHGITRDWRSFAVLLPELARKFHVFAVDLRGHGASGRVENGYTIPQFADDIAEVLQNVAPDGAMVFGHSLGGMTGMELASRADSRVRALIVGDSMIRPTNLKRNMYHGLFLQLHELMLQCQTPEQMAKGIAKIEIELPGLEERVRLEELPGNTDAVVTDWARSAIRTDPDALQMSLDERAFEGWLPEKALAQIQCPALLLQANPELDALLSDDDVELAKQLVRRLEHVKFRLLGHALFLQNSRTVLNTIIPFLEKHAGEQTFTTR